MAYSRRYIRRAAALVGLVLTLCGVTATASALTPIYNSSFASTGPRNLATNPKTGDVYVGEPSGHRIRRFTAAGVPIDSSTWSANVLSNPYGLGVNWSTGDVYVVENTAAQIYRYTSAGAFVAKWGGTGTTDGKFGDPQDLAINQSTGDVYVCDTGGKSVERFSSAGVFKASYPMQVTESFWLASAIAINQSNGNYYLVDGTAHTIEYFSSSGEFLGSWTDSRIGRCYSVAIHPSTGDVYVSSQGNANNPEYAQSVTRFTADGTFVEMIIGGTNPLSFPMGLQFSGYNGQLYLADYGHDRVVTLGITDPVVAKIAGTITNATEGAAVSGATVSLISATTGSVVATTSADSLGSYTFNVTPNTNYRVGVSAAGYEPAFLAASGTAPSLADAVSVSAEYYGDSVQADIALTPVAYEVTVSVIDDATLAPMAGVSVAAWAPDGLGGYTPYTWAETDALGMVTLTVLPDTPYVFVTGGTNYYTEFYANAPTAAAATTVTVGASAPTESITIDLSHQWVLDGAVTASATGLPRSGVTVTLYQRAGNGTWEPYPGAVDTTDSSGTYSFTIPRGEYQLKYEATGYQTVWANGATSLDAASPITVSSSLAVDQAIVATAPTTPVAPTDPTSPDAPLTVPASAAWSLALLALGGLATVALTRRRAAR